MLISAAFCQAQVGCSPPASVTVTPDTWYAGTINYATITTPNFNVDNIGAYCASVDLTTTSGAEVPLVLWDNLNGGPGWESIGVEPAASVPTEAALFVLEYICDPDVGIPCPAGTGADDIVWKVTVPIQIIGCPAPTIASVTPSGWWAGQQQDITITGNCFMTSSDSGGPSQVTVTAGAGAVTLSNVNVVSSTQITATVKVTKKAPAETVTLTVANPAGGSGGPQSVKASPAPVVLPVPVIKWKDKEISGDKAKNQSVIVGQPVELTTTPATLPGGFTISKSTWDIDGTTIKQYHESDDVGFSVDPTDLQSPNTSFYWLYLGDPLNVTYEYCATDPSGSQICTSPQAKATFKATKPSISLTATEPYGEDKVNELAVCGQKAKEAVMYDTLTWNGPAPYSCGPYLVELDQAYPFPGVNADAPSVAYDAPAMGLPSKYTSAKRDFDAIMYLLWKPDQLSSTATASIPLPIGYQEWQFVATTDQKQPIGSGKWEKPDTTAHGDNGGYQASQAGDNDQYGYPSWNGVSDISSCNE